MNDTQSKPEQASAAPQNASQQVPARKPHGDQAPGKHAPAKDQPAKTGAPGADQEKTPAQTSPSNDR